MSTENEIKEDLLYALISSCHLAPAPAQISFNGFVSVLIGIGKDDTAEIFIPVDSLEMLYERVKARSAEKIKGLPCVTYNLLGKANIEWAPAHAGEINYHE